MPTVIKVENLSKKYIISHKRQERYTALRDIITNKVKGLFPKNRKPDLAREEFWALKDINLEIKQGERVGIIGRNGAGKTTLLKLLSKITEPTKGRISIKGRVASLLEVGTGFHPELTGRENIFLNGAILGMTKFEIKNKFDEIVDFAEVEKFLDTPVKHYSSGMYVRLAFAVAAHLEPEILVIDEVLAVGDMQFQKKCLGKMEDVSEKEGRTVIFVSHNLAAISNLCEKCIMLEMGKIVISDQTEIVVNHYLSKVSETSLNLLRDRKDRQGDGRLRFIDTWIENAKGQRVSCVGSGEYMKIIGLYEVKKGVEISNLILGFAISSITGVSVTDLSNATTGDYFMGKIPDKGRVECVIPKLPLNAGSYSYNVIARSGIAIEDWIIKAGKFDVESSDYFKSGKTVDANQGMFLIDHKWNLSKQE